MSLRSKYLEGFTQRMWGATSTPPISRIAAGRATLSKEASPTRTSIGPGSQSRIVPDHFNSKTFVDSDHASRSGSPALQRNFLDCERSFTTEAESPAAFPQQ
jgi:hypothetical protein